MKKFFIITGTVLLTIIIALIVYVYFSGPALPPDTDEIIAQVIESEVPEIIKGNTGYAKNANVSIWYESIEPEQSLQGTILIIMGITNDALAWPPYFMQPFVDAGYRVVRYDHRGTGMSDWLEEWSEENAYTLDDMSGDGFAILDELNVESAHIIGVSMGGMIGQTMAINNPDRVISLTSIMSSGYIEDPNLPPINQSFIFDLVLLGLKYMVIGSEANIIKMTLSARLLLRAGYETEIDVKDDAERMIYNLRKRRGLNYNVSQQHLTAVSLSGSRYDALQKLNVPSLIIHGKSDPLIPFAHGLKCAELIPDADTLWIEKMGHDISPGISEVIADRILYKYSSLWKM